MPPKRKSTGKTLPRSTKANKKPELEEPKEENDLGFIFVRETKKTRRTPTTRKNSSNNRKKTIAKSSLGISKKQGVTSPIPNKPFDLTDESEDEFVKYITPSKPTRTQQISKKRQHKSLAPPTLSKMIHERTRYSEAFIPLPKDEPLSSKKIEDIRKKKRRSSFARRGKRASSIGSGFTALPHPSIRTEELYRHISPEVPDPIRMKQLLTWCAQRAMDSQKNRGDPEAFQIAKTIQESIVSMLVNNQVNTSWYHRQGNDQSKDHSTLRLEHPQNLENIKKKKEYEEQISRLQAEDKQWINLIKKHNQYHANVADRYPPPTVPPQKIHLSPELHDDYLDEKKRALLRSLDEASYKSTDMEDIDQMEYKVVPSLLNSHYMQLMILNDECRLIDCIISFTTHRNFLG
ncbi:hypothetical protein K7432_013769 [Basidiobolus ranarum]|uniref:Uncharacterized protein n=1 Tax=Basidiobolus ranarum TaxID=34480 RepID=A0ABR2VQI9_9FUNG